MRIARQNGSLSRRKILRSIAVTAAATLSVPFPAHARLWCSVPMGGIQECEAGIDSSLADVTAAAVGGQHASQWCWAACIEMIFRYYRRRVSQERIVAET